MKEKYEEIKEIFDILSNNENIKTKTSNSIINLVNQNKRIFDGVVSQWESGRISDVVFEKSIENMKLNLKALYERSKNCYKDGIIDSMLFDMQSRKKIYEIKPEIVDKGKNIKPSKKAEKQLTSNEVSNFKEINDKIKQEDEIFNLVRMSVNPDKLINFILASSPEGLIRINELMGIIEERKESLLISDKYIQSIKTCIEVFNRLKQPNASNVDQYKLAVVDGSNLRTIVDYVRTLSQEERNNYLKHFTNEDVNKIVEKLSQQQGKVTQENLHTIVEYVRKIGRVEANKYLENFSKKDVDIILDAIMGHIPEIVEVRDYRFHNFDDDEKSANIIDKKDEVIILDIPNHRMYSFNGKEVNMINEDTRKYPEDVDNKSKLLNNYIVQACEGDLDKINACKDYIKKLEKTEEFKELREKLKEPDKDAEYITTLYKQLCDKRDELGIEFPLKILTIVPESIEEENDELDLIYFMENTAMLDFIPYGAKAANGKQAMLFSRENAQGEMVGVSSTGDVLSSWRVNEKDQMELSTYLLINNKAVLSKKRILLETGDNGNEIYQDIEYDKMGNPIEYRSMVTKDGKVYVEAVKEDKRNAKGKGETKNTKRKENDGKNASQKIDRE